MTKKDRVADTASEKNKLKLHKLRREAVSGLKFSSWSEEEQDLIDEFVNTVSMLVISQMVV